MKKPFASSAWPGWAVFVAGLLLGATFGCRADDFGTWDTMWLKFLDTEHWTFSALGQLRFRDNSTELFAWLVSPQVVYKASPYFHLGMNYTWLPARPPGREDFVNAQRWETEIIPIWPVSHRLTLDVRNRLELIWAEGASGTSQRLRVRPQATYQLHGLGPLESVFCNNEFFYSFNQRDYNQNRCVPLGLNFRLDSHLLFTLDYMLWSVRGRHGWSYANVLGTQLSVSF